MRLRGRDAAQMPSGSAMATAMTKARPARTKVLMRRGHSTASTGWL